MTSSPTPDAAAAPPPEGAPVAPPPGAAPPPTGAPVARAEDLPPAKDASASSRLKRKSAKESPTVLDTSTGRGDGLNRCPKCGSTEIGPVKGTSSLACHYCRHVWEGLRLEERHGLGEGIDSLKGRVTSTGTATIMDDATLITLKCTGCGSEVVINTETSLQSRCHWCRQTLSINSQIPNGAVPDGVLPFSLTRDQAVARIKEFAGKRRFFAQEEFKKQFTPENVMAVYLPYMVVDGNLRARLDGRGEVLKRTYTRGSGNNKTTYYDADSFQVYREFDMVVDDLIVESSSERADIDPLVNTNNVVNAILPFDVKDMVAFDSNYLRDATSERRDLEIDGVVDRVNGKFLTVAREKANPLIKHFNRGVRWESEQLVVHGTRWVSVYLPVWLYSHYERKPGGATMLHYIAVNGRNGQTMGSIPVNKGKLLCASLAVGGSVGFVSLLIVIGVLFSG